VVIRFVDLGYTEEQIGQLGSTLYSDTRDGLTSGCWPTPFSAAGCIWAGTAGPLSLPDPGRFCADSHCAEIAPASWVVNDPNGDSVCTVAPWYDSGLQSPKITTYAWCMFDLPMQPNSGDRCPGVLGPVYWWDAAANHFGYLNGISALPQLGPIRFGAHVSHGINMNGEDDYYSAPDGEFKACFNEYTHL
jgi:hypothetical protein